MPSFAFEIDGNPVDDPLNIRRTQKSLTRDPETDGILKEVTTEFTFKGGGSAYSAIETAYNADKCSKVDGELFYDCTNGPATTSQFTGIGYVADAEWLEGPAWETVTLKFRDDHFTAKIRNGIDTKFYIGVGRSRNDVSYTGATAQSIDLFVPSSGNYNAAVQAIEMYTVSGAFEDLVSAMTDDTVGFTNNITELDTLCVLRGSAIANTGSTGFAPYISFKQLFEEIKKKYNIGYYIDTSGPTPTLVIDEKANLFSTTSAVTLSPRKVNRRIDTTKLYQRIRVGSNETQKAAGTYTYPDIRYKGHKLEEYHTGEDGGSSLCHTENSLDLVSNFIIDSNVIEKLVTEVIGAGGISTNEDDIFLIECNVGLTQAERYDIINQGTLADYTYNEGLMNDAVIPRFDGDIFADLLIFLGDGNDGFEADKNTLTAGTPPTSTFARFDYNNETSDPNGNYDNTAGQYHFSAPVDGFYRFSSSVEVSNLVLNAPDAISIDVQIIQERRPAGGGAVIESRTQTFNLTADGEPVFEPLGFFLDATDEVNVRVTITDVGPGPGTTTYDVDGGTFKTTEVTTGGGTYADFDIDDTRLILYEFKVPLGLADSDSIFDNQTQALTINLPKAGGTKKMWVQRLDWDYLNNEGATFECITTENT